MLCAMVGLASVGPTGAAPPMADNYLYEGKLADGEKALLRHLETTPADDEARFGLGAIQFLGPFEKLGSGLDKYGLRTNTFIPGMPRNLQRLLPYNDKPETLNYAAFRKLVQEVVDSFDTAAKTLGAIKDDKLKLPLEVGKIKIHFWGRGEPISAALSFRQKVFLDPPKRLDVVRWLQGTVARPYLEKGDTTKLANVREIRNLDRVFGGANFFGFAAWFN
jgi:hypothetical protein